MEIFRCTGIFKGYFCATKVSTVCLLPCAPNNNTLHFRTVSSWSRNSLTPNSTSEDVSIGEESSIDGSFSSGTKKGKRKRVVAEGSLLPADATAGFTLACNKMASYFDNNSSDGRGEASVRDPNVVLGKLPPAVIRNNPLVAF